MIAECRLIRFRQIGDERGMLMAIEGSRDLPFYARRLFVISGVPAGASRGAHANLKSDQFILPLTGGLTVRVYDGRAEARYSLDRPDEGLLVPAGVWNDLYGFLPDTQVVVLASDHYDGAAYIRDIAEYDAIRKGQTT